MGHPAPFNLKFIGIGNEQWGSEYPERLEQVMRKQSERPILKLRLLEARTIPKGKQFEYLWPEMKRLKADLVDEHFYRPESWFLSQGPLR